MKKQEKVINSLKEKIGEKMFNRIVLISEEKFGNKQNLKIKFYQSIIDGYINPYEIWTDDENISELKKKIDSATESEKESLIIKIVDTYDTKDPKIKDLLRKYNRYLKKLII
jgi:hypothetical protein